MKTRILIMAVLPDRKDFVDYLVKKLPEAEIVIDQDRNSINTFKSLLKKAGMDPVLVMEDDVILTSDFISKVSAEIQKRPNQVIQFFSRRKKDIEVGSREESGANFLSNLCFYLPRGYANGILEFSEHWKGIVENPTGNDILVADFLKHNKLKYYLHVPSLVQHRVAVSMIDSRRSSKRQSQTFEN